MMVEKEINDFLIIENKEREEFWGGDPNDFLPCISVDCVVFTFYKGVMKILLAKFKEYDKWLLPGGFVGMYENLDDAAQRILTSRTGITDIYLEQFHTFGNATRTNKAENENILKQINKISIFKDANWFLKRYMSIGYFAFAEYSKLDIYENNMQTVRWFAMEDIPELYADHKNIINKAIEHVGKNINTMPIGTELLPEKFTMTELRTIYESILSRKLDRRNFQRKILSTGLVVKLKETNKKPGVKPATLFSFNHDGNINKGYSIFE